jgi:hypothetical protein
MRPHRLLDAIIMGQRPQGLHHCGIGVVRNRLQLPKSELLVVGPTLQGKIQ